MLARDFSGMGAAAVRSRSSATPQQRQTRTSLPFGARVVNHVSSFPSPTLAFSARDGLRGQSHKKSKRRSGGTGKLHAMQCSTVMPSSILGYSFAAQLFPFRRAISTPFLHANVKINSNVNHAQSPSTLVPVVPTVCPKGFSKYEASLAQRQPLKQCKPIRRCQDVQCSPSP
jgi:hypothetical protein